ncbi:MAG: hypothetical protein Ct9H300mP1_10840 [Planctomycetaceae bacterium]|nr:MAG: hypothetical protein Ct9H300mP1_10840 [Planctomycetaceae bacterium]
MIDGESVADVPAFIDRTARQRPSRPRACHTRWAVFGFIFDGIARREVTGRVSTGFGGAPPLGAAGPPCPASGNPGG